MHGIDKQKIENYDSLQVEWQSLCNGEYRGSSEGINALLLQPGDQYTGGWYFIFKLEMYHQGHLFRRNPGVEDFKGKSLAR